MTPENPNPRFSRRVVVEGVVGVVLLALFIWTGWYLNSAGFQEVVRRRVVAELELVTGGAVEMRQFRWNLSRLEFEVDDLTIHGLEPPTALPYAHVDRLRLRLKILSLVSLAIGLRSFDADRPVIHIMVDAHGNTNQPTPKIQLLSNRSPADRLFDLAIESAQLTDGELWWNDQRIPLDLRAEQVLASLNFVRAANRLVGSVHVARMESRLSDFYPLTSDAAVEFSLSHSDLEIKALRSKSGQSHFEASGRITNFQDPKVELAYRLSLDLQQAALVTGNPQLRGGRMDVNGRGSATLRDFSAAGNLFVHDLQWSNGSTRLPRLNAQAEFAVRPRRLTLSRLNGALAGGTISGAVEIVNWSLRPEPNYHSAEKGSAELQLRNIDLDELGAAISKSSLQEQPLRPAGKVNADTHIVWERNIRNLAATLSAHLEPPSQPAANSLPVKGDLHGAYYSASRTLEVSDAHFETPHSSLVAKGTLAAVKTSRLAIDLKTTDLRELEPFWTVLNLPRPPLEVRGNASFSGQASGTLAAPALTGHLMIGNFDYIPASAPANAGQQTRIAIGKTRSSPAARSPGQHWEHLATDIALSPSSLTVGNANLSRGEARILFSASATLQHYHFGDRDPFQAKVSVHKTALSDLQQLVGRSYPLTGMVDLKVQVAGTEVDPHGQGSIQIVDGTALGEPFRGLRSDLFFANHEARLDHLTLALNGATVAGNGAYNLASRGFRFDLSGANFDLQHIAILQSHRMEVQGKANFHATGSGSLDSPQISAAFHLTHLVLNGEATGDLDATAVSHGADLQLNAHSQFHDAQLALAGSIRLRDLFPAQLTLTFSNLDIDPVLHAFLQGSITQHSSVAGNITLRGPLLQPHDLNLAGELQQVQMDMENVKLQSEGPVRFFMSNGIFNLARLHIVGEDTDFTAQGSIPLQGSGATRLAARGKLNLKILESYNPDLVAYGITTLDLSVRGSVLQPEMTGRVQISNGGISYVDLPNGLSQINGTMFFNENRLQIESLTAHTGGGILNVGGSMAYASGLYFNFNAKGAGVRLRYPPGISASADADLRFAGTLQQSLLSGDVTVTKFGLNPHFDFAQYLARSNQPAVRADSPLNHIQLDVHVVSARELQVQTSLAGASLKRITGDADLHLRGTVAHPVVLGRVNIVQGDISFYGTEYHLERGDIQFVNPTTIEPVLDLEASARVRDVDITLGFHGPLNKLSTTFRSDPPLPSADIIALLALGRTREESALSPQPQPNYSGSASSALLGQALNSSVNSRVQRLFGVSRIKIDPAAGGPENNPNARLTVEQQVSNRVTLTYITNLSQSAQQIIQMEIQVTKNIYIVAVRDQFGVAGVDIKVRQRKR
jgi:translocation and assembly module TamB